MSSTDSSGPQYHQPAYRLPEYQTSAGSSPSDGWVNPLGPARRLSWEDTAVDRMAKESSAQRAWDRPAPPAPPIEATPPLEPVTQLTATMEPLPPVDIQAPLDAARDRGPDPAPRARDQQPTTRRAKRSNPHGSWPPPQHTPAPRRAKKKSPVSVPLFATCLAFAVSFGGGLGFVLAIMGAFGMRKLISKEGRFVHLIPIIAAAVVGRILGQILLSG